MKPIRKIIATGLCAAALVGASVLGTMAYFTDNDAVTNTFTVGKVDISLDELDVDDSTANAERDTENKYHLLPGHEYVKDPTVHIEAGSENCYVFVTVDNGLAAIEMDENDGTKQKTGYKKIAGQMNNNNWSVLKDADNNDVTYKDLTVYVHAGNGTAGNADYKANVIVKDSSQNTDLTVFSYFIIDGDTVIGGTNNGTAQQPNTAGQYYINDFQNEEIKVIAYAVQADGFDTALAAWQATYGK